MGLFQKSNWTRTCGSEKARVYSPQSQGFGIQAITVASNSTSIITQTVPFQFQGNGQIEVSIPAGPSQGVQTGLSLGEAQLLAPASGSYGAGNHPRIQFKVANSTAAAITATASDVIFCQY